MTKQIDLGTYNIPIDLHFIGVLSLIMAAIMGIISLFIKGAING